MAPDMRNVVRLPIAKSRPANRRSGTIGSATRLLPPDERSEQQRPGDEAADDLGARPADVVGAGERPDERDDAGGDEPDSDEVEPLRRAVALGQQPKAEEHGDDADRDVDPEDPVPVDALRDRAADDRAHRDGETREAAVDPDDHPAPLGRESRRQDREAQRQHDRAAEPLHRPGDDQLGQVRRQRARDRGDREQRQPDGEDLPPSEPVAERGGGDDPGGERDAVGVQRPLQRGETRRAGRAACAAAP